MIKFDLKNKAARPIPDMEFYSQVKNSIYSTIDNLYNSELQSIFLKKYKNWILNSKNNKIIGLDSFKELTCTYGTAQSFDEWYFKNNKKRLRILKGDFFYHSICTRNKIEFCYYEDADLNENDFMIISVPFSDSGNEPDNLDNILKKCEELNIPVLIDCAYMIMAGDINLNLNYDCIKCVSFSFTKGFYGCERLRIGIRFKKEYEDDGIDVANSMCMISPIGLKVAIDIMDKFDFDSVYNKYRKTQLKICKENNLIASKSVIFGLGNISDLELSIFNRGTKYRRICLSQFMGDMELDNLKNK